MRYLSISGLRWAKKTGIFIIGILKIMTVDTGPKKVFLSKYSLLLKKLELSKMCEKKVMVRELQPNDIAPIF